MDKPKIYFAGAGGIGMAALERYYLSRGYDVAGYDRTPSELTAALQAEGVNITFDSSVDAIPAGFRGHPEIPVVYTPALPADHPQLAYFRAAGYDVKKRSQVLGDITRESRSLCFAGTHGKTTTSSMAAHILHTSTVGCNAFLGGVLRNYNSNLLLSATSPFSVIEADEYDRSFHTLRPYIAVITATDPDHLDIYGTEEAYLESFAHFTELISPDGFLVIHEGLKLRPRPVAGVTTYTYGVESGDYHAANVRHVDGTIRFDVVTPSGETFRDIELGVPVDINIDNAVAAIAVCHLTGRFEPEAMRRAMATFQGAKRRFEFWMKESRNGRPHVIIDDYAHHPDEVKASIRSVRALYPDAKLTVAFQPHLYTRTRDFAPEFASALSEADSLILVDLYPARELPIPGVSSQIILDRVTISDKTLVARGDLVDTIKMRNFEILLTLGAGDICNLLPEILANARN